MGAFGNLVFATSLVVALCAVFVPAFLADPEDASRIGYFGEDFEGNLCGQLAWHHDGRRGRDLRSRPYAYWLNASSIVCVRDCPRLADELVCEYSLESLSTGAQRAALGARCFAQLRTRAAFPACLPHSPSAALSVDRWLYKHAIDQLAADTLQAAPVILGCWVAAGLASLLSLGGLLLAPRLTLFLTMLGALGTSCAGAAMLLPHGVRSLAAARAPLGRNEATYLREELPGVLQFALGWAACAAVGLLVLTLCSRVRRVHVAAALLATPTKPLLAMPSLLLLPLYLYIAIGSPLASWLTAVVYLAAPCGAVEGCGTGAAVWRLLWPLSLMAPYWLASAVTAWAYCAVGGAVGCWYASLAPAAASSGRAPPPARPLPSWPLWRSGWLSADAHFGSIGAAAALLPFATIVRVVVPPVASPPPRSINPYSRCCVGFLQGVLRCCLALPRTVHPGGLIYLARQPPIGAPPTAARDGATSAATLAAAYLDDELSLDASPLAPPLAASTFLEAGERCSGLFARGSTPLVSAREAVHYFYSLLKWTVGVVVAFVGWLCLTNAEAQPLMSPVWPTAIILEGSLALASATLAVHEAALEALLQAYAEEEAAEPPTPFESNKRAPPPAAEPLAPTAERAATAAALFGTGEGYGSMSSAAPYSALVRDSEEQLAARYGSLATSGPAGAYAAAPSLADDFAPTDLDQLPPSYDTLPLSAAALAGA